MGKGFIVVNNIDSETDFNNPTAYFKLWAFWGFDFPHLPKCDCLERFGGLISLTFLSVIA